MSAASIRNLALLAAACFLASWFLPVMTDVPGWMAFRYAFSSVWPFGPDNSLPAEEAVPQVASALTNGAFVVMFIMIMRRRVPRPKMLFQVSVLCFAMNLYWFVQLARDGSLGDLLAGYYVWMVAFALLVFIAWQLWRGRSAALQPVEH